MSLLLLISLVLSLFLLIALYLLMNEKNKTEKKQYLHELNLQARDYLLRSINHELRAPMARLMVEVEFVKDESVRRNLQKEVFEMQELIEELMEIEKIKMDPSEKVQCHLNELITQVGENLKLEVNNIAFDFKDECYIQGHPEQLKKLFKNLIENASKYKNNDSIIKVKLEKISDSISFTILNEGDPIPSEDIPFLFEPFFRSSKVQENKEIKGKGIGLNICKEIADKHNAKIKVTSKPNLGTLFKVSFNYSH